MANYRIYVKQEYGTAEWGNSFHITAASESEAATRGASIAALLAVSVWSGVKFTGVRVSTAAEDGRTGRTFPMNSTGAVNMANPLPIFCVGRLLFYPGVKQNGKTDVRFIGNGTSQVAGDWTSSFYASLVNLADAIIDLGYVCDKSYTPYTGSGADPRVGMHQTYRKAGDRVGIDPGDV